MHMVFHEIRSVVQWLSLRICNQKFVGSNPTVVKNFSFCNFHLPRVPRSSTKPIIMNWMTLFCYLLGYKVKRVTCKFCEAQSASQKFTSEPASLFTSINTKKVLFNPYIFIFMLLFFIVQFRSRDLGAYTEKYMHPFFKWSTAEKMR